ncbi:hypothetical protein [Natronosalvus rutilus]|uniref:Uncharacterized protein n=1 Tax=Natronosalvus rutilus TaxID=2953753 RepID=A0A9E7SU30_9EURY|nr:hypothetical protein [Natronosalvus rutilus]UTF54309.1 hypothetical protein NGM29_03235 [Natronosalvus rutilus]
MQAPHYSLEAGLAQCMCATFTTDDVGKTVENDEGAAVGVVVSVEDDTAFVEPEPGVVDSLRAALGWSSDPQDAVPLHESDVQTVDETIRLEAFPSSEGPSWDERETDDTEREGAETDTAKTEDSGASRPADIEDAPPEGDKTVTKERELSEEH